MPYSLYTNIGIEFVEINNESLIKHSDNRVSE